MSGCKHSEASKEAIRRALTGKKKSKDHVEHMRKALTGKTHSDKTKDKHRIFMLDQNPMKSLVSRKRVGESHMGDKNAMKNPIFVKKMLERRRGVKPSKKAIENWSQAKKKQVKEGTHNWPSERPCNNPTERVLDLIFVPIFLADTNHNFKVENQDGREFQLDFVSWPLHFGVEADEPDHKKSKKKAWDDARDQYIEDSKELDFTHRYSTEEAIENLVAIVKEIYVLANQQREKYNLVDLPILVYDERWTTYLERMQELLKEWFYSKERARRFKIFRDKKREIDKQWLKLVEEQDKKYNSNLATVLREILEKDLKLNFRNVVSMWRFVI
jgi:hypothetical protein